MLIFHHMVSQIASQVLHFSDPYQTPNYFEAPPVYLEMEKGPAPWSNFQPSPPPPTDKSSPTSVCEQSLTLYRVLSNKLILDTYNAHWRCRKRVPQICNKLLSHTDRPDKQTDSHIHTLKTCGATRNPEIPRTGL